MQTETSRVISEQLMIFPCLQSSAAPQPGAGMCCAPLPKWLCQVFKGYSDNVLEEEAKASTQSFCTAQRRRLGVRFTSTPGT